MEFILYAETRRIVLFPSYHVRGTERHKNNKPRHSHFYFIDFLNSCRDFTQTLNKDTLYFLSELVLTRY